MTQQSAPKRFRVELRHISCSNITSRVKRFDCNFTEIATGNYAIDLYFLFDQELSRNAELHSVVYLKVAGKFVKFLDLKLNICNTLKQTLSMPLAQKIAEEFSGSSNFPRFCPFKGVSM